MQFLLKANIEIATNVMSERRAICTNVQLTRDSEALCMLTVYWGFLCITASNTRPY